MIFKYIFVESANWFKTLGKTHGYDSISLFVYGIKKCRLNTGFSIIKNIIKSK